MELAAVLVVPNQPPLVLCPAARAWRRVGQQVFYYRSLPERGFNGTLTTFNDIQRHFNGI
jgi:hypothetical protein